MTRQALFVTGRPLACLHMLSYTLDSVFLVNLDQCHTNVVCVFVKVTADSEESLHGLKADQDIFS